MNSVFLLLCLTDFLIDRQVDQTTYILCPESINCLCPEVPATETLIRSQCMDKDLALEFCQDVLTDEVLTVITKIS